jgi:hypothetical protein
MGWERCCQGTSHAHAKDHPFMLDSVQRQERGSSWPASGKRKSAPILVYGKRSFGDEDIFDAFQEIHEPETGLGATN